MAETIVAGISLGMYQTDAVVVLLSLAEAAVGCEGIETIVQEAYDFAQSQGKTRDLAETFANADGAAACSLCEDYEPTEDVSCAERQGWGECEAEWMQFGYFCAKTCNYCRTAAAPVSRSVSRRVRGPTVAESTEQAIASGASELAATNLLNFIQDGLVDEVIEGILSAADEYNSATILTLALALRQVPVQYEDVLATVFQQLMPDYSEVVANALQYAARRRSGVEAAGNVLITILNDNNGQFPDLAQLAASNCRGIPNLIEYVVETDEQAVAAFVQDNDAILQCLTESDEVLSVVTVQQPILTQIGDSGLTVPEQEEMVPQVEGGVASSQTEVANPLGVVGDAEQQGIDEGQKLFMLLRLLCEQLLKVADGISL
eukprot:TRINITY_DN4967_c0_g1_i6.p1 TRINITY_DN4967_c0_g1~~TRINITY_DN4967_c0_g1_i6.p1  ORF type:complete len:412 (-),score=67.60 TRINITY_DN4967_c0_g1_i6:1-1125(-)